MIDDVDETELTALEDELSGHERRVGEAGIKEKIAELEEALKNQQKELKKYDDDIKKLREDVDNLQEIDAALSGKCFQDSDVEIP